MAGANVFRQLDQMATELRHERALREAALESARRSLRHREKLLVQLQEARAAAAQALAAGPNGAQAKDLLPDEPSTVAGSESEPSECSVLEAALRMGVTSNGDDKSDGMEAARSEADTMLDEMLAGADAEAFQSEAVLTEMASEESARDTEAERPQVSAASEPCLDETWISEDVKIPRSVPHFHIGDEAADVESSTGAGQIESSCPDLAKATGPSSEMATPDLACEIRAGTESDAAPKIRARPPVPPAAAPPAMAAEWMPNTSTCALCGDGFLSMLNPRHHCRRCGRNICGACSPFRMALRIPLQRPATPLGRLRGAVQRAVTPSRLSRNEALPPRPGTRDEEITHRRRGHSPERACRGRRPSFGPGDQRSRECSQEPVSAYRVCSECHHECLTMDMEAKSKLERCNSSSMASFGGA